MSYEIYKFQELWPGTIFWFDLGWCTKRLIRNHRVRTGARHVVPARLAHQVQAGAEAARALEFAVLRISALAFADRAFASSLCVGSFDHRFSPAGPEPGSLEPTAPPTLNCRGA